MGLRYYQREAVDAFLDHWSAGGGNALVDLATGTGKSMVAATLTRQVVEAGGRVGVVTHVRELVRQNFLEMIGLWPQVDAGIYCAGLRKAEGRRPVTFASIQSIWNKTDRLHAWDMMLIDECHLVPAAAHGRYRKFVDAMLEKNPGMRVGGLTATPYRLGEGRLDEGDDALFESTIYQYSIAQGIADGHLSPLAGKRGDVEIDVSKVRKVAGEFNAAALERQAEEIVEEAVDELVDLGADRRSWLIFGSGVQHAYHIRDLVREHGITAETVTGETPAGERDRIVEWFKSGQIRCLTNANVLCLDDLTEILTSSGFVGIDGITPEHLIAAWKPDGTVEFTPPETIVRRPRSNGEAMVSAGPFRVTGNHRMVIRCGEGRKSVKVVPALDLAAPVWHAIPAYGVAPPCNVVPDQPSIANAAALARSNAFNYRKRGMAPNEARRKALAFGERRASRRFLTPAELSVDQCAFIGFWLGDGTKSGGRVSLAQSFAYPDTVEWVDELLSRLNLHHSRRVYPPANKSTFESVRWTLARGTGGRGQEVAGNGFFSLEPYLEKAGSRLLWGLNTSQFRALLNGFWRADGNHHSRSRGAYVCGTQRELYEVLQAIAAVRGINATLRKLAAPRSRNHRQQYYFGWGGRGNWHVKSAKVETDERDERVWCVTSSTGFLICRRNGRVFVTGNTTGFNARNVDLVGMMRSTLSTSLYVQMVGRGTRLWPGKDNCLVLDWGGNIRRHGPVDIAEPPARAGKGAGRAEVGDVRARTCDGCGLEIDVAAEICPHCGKQVERKFEAKHDARADGETPVLSSEPVGPKWLPVVDWAAFRHAPLDGRTPSLRVEITAGLATYSEWVCFEHDGYAGRKAVDWWSLHGGQMPTPADVAEAFDRFDELERPTGIAVEKDGKYLRITKRTFQEIQQREAA